MCLYFPLSVSDAQPRPPEPSVGPYSIRAPGNALDRVTLPRSDLPVLSPWHLDPHLAWTKDFTRNGMVCLLAPPSASPPAHLLLYSCDRVFRMPSSAALSALIGFRPLSPGHTGDRL